MEETVHVHRGSKNLLRSLLTLDNLATVGISALLFLLPVFFVPVIGASLQFSKFLLLAGVVLVLAVIWILQRLKDGVFELPVNMLSLAGLAVVATTVLSALLSGTIGYSFIGQGFETDTVLFLVFAMGLLLLIPSIFTTKRQMLNAYFVFLISLAVLGVIHLVRLAFPGFLTFGILAYSTDSLIGKWNDLAIFFGLGALLSLITLESLPLNRVVRGIVYGVLAVAVFFLAVINFSLIWYILGGLSLVLFVYGVVMGRVGSKSNAKINLPIAPGIVLIVSVLFIFAGAQIGAELSTRLGVSQAEVRQTWQGTMDLAKNVIVQKAVIAPVLGIGPNNFEQAWLMHKPTAVNSTMFWNTSFNYGVGIIPSSLVTTGVLGFLSWIAFLGALVYIGFRSILSKIADSTTQYLIVSSFIGSLYLWLFAVVYVPGIAVFTLAFLFTGLFISSLTIGGIFQPLKVEYFKNAKIGFISVFVLVVALIAAIGLFYVYVSKLAAVGYYQKAVVAVNNGNFADAQNNLLQSIRYVQSDVYYRALSQAYLVHLANVIANANTTTPTESLQLEFTTLSNNALTSAQSAVTKNPRNYRNFAALGDVWSALVPYGVQSSYENAVAAYNEVIKLNPQNPTAYLQLARVETVHNNVPQAKNYIEQAVKMKYNYTDAYYLLAQIQIAQGDTKDAINSVAAAALSEGTNPGLFYQLGLLYYSEKDYTNASAAFSRAVALNPSYSNARYYLGLSLYELDRVSDAIGHFEEVLKLNPDSSEVQSIITNLKAGRAPFSQNKTVVETPAETEESEE